MNRRDCLLAAGAALPALWSGARADGVPASPGESVPWPAPLPLLDGSTWQPRDGLAQIVVFWSTTCPFCRRHNVHVEQLHRALAGRSAAVLSAARDADPALVRRVAAERGYTFPISMAWRDLAAALSRRNVIPLTVTVDRGGRLRQVIPGEMFEADVIELATLAG
ncbi:MAG: TlpA family protein disulfide reductase [Rubrivivax sp.]|nr:TlpA family protein disulfide reductase [Rubrivivax sp.]MDH5340498.1 TlpA family protein disulfide reductase [Rubrivivax sp.]